MAATTRQKRTGPPATETRRIADQIYRDHHRQLMNVADRNSADRLDAEEALQDSFLIFLNRFDPKTDTPPLAWITLTLKRRCWAIYQRRRGAPDQAATHIIGEAPDQHPNPEERAEITEHLARNRDRLRALRPDQRRALVLLAIGFSYQEIMQITDWTYTKVNRSIRDGRKQLGRTT